MLKYNNLLKLSVFGLVIGLFLIGLFTSCSNKDPYSTDDPQSNNDQFLVPGEDSRVDDALNQLPVDNPQSTNNLFVPFKSITGLDGYCGLYNQSYKFRGVKEKFTCIDISGKEMNVGDYIVEHMVYLDGSNRWRREIVNVVVLQETSPGNKTYHCYCRLNNLDASGNRTEIYCHTLFVEAFEEGAKFRMEILVTNLGNSWFEIKHKVKSYQSYNTYTKYRTIRDTGYCLSQCNQIDIAFENRCESDLDQSSHIHAYQLYGMYWNSTSWKYWDDISTNWFTVEREECYDNLVSISYNTSATYVDIHHIKR